MEKNDKILCWIVAVIISVFIGGIVYCEFNILLDIGIALIAMVTFASGFTEGLKNGFKAGLETFIKVGIALGVLFGISYNAIYDFLIGPSLDGVIVGFSFSLFIAFGGILVLILYDVFHKSPQKNLKKQF